MKTWACVHTEELAVFRGRGCALNVGGWGGPKPCKRELTWPSAAAILRAEASGGQHSLEKTGTPCPWMYVIWW